jgi:hypothetical protein
MARLPAVRLAPRFSPFDEIDVLLFKIYQPFNQAPKSLCAKAPETSPQQRPKPGFGHNRRQQASEIEVNRFLK